MVVPSSASAAASVVASSGIAPKPGRLSPSPLLKRVTSGALASALRVTSSSVRGISPTVKSLIGASARVGPYGLGASTGTPSLFTGTPLGAPSAESNSSN